MDNLVAEASDVMSPALDFGLPKTAQYVTDRRHVNYFPSGSNIYTSATGNKNIRFYVTGEDGTYLDQVFGYLLIFKTKVILTHNFYDHYQDYMRFLIVIDAQ